MVLILFIPDSLTKKYEHAESSSSADYFLHTFSFLRNKEI